MDILAAVLAVTAASFLMTSVFLFKTLRQTKASLQELLREAEAPEQTPKIETGDVYFKIDDAFNISFVDEAGIRALGYHAEDLIGRPLFDCLVENSDANKEFLTETLSKLAKKQTTFNTQMLIRRADGKNMLMLTRIRPILDEILQCRGLSFLCKDISQADKMQEKIKDYEALDPFTDVLNEQTLEQRFEHDFKLANRYNKELSSIVIELKDIYDFIAKGIDFETADKMLKDISDIVLDALPEGCYAGRVDKTKIVMVLKDAPREQALQKAVALFGQAVEAVRALRVDAANAQMIVIAYSDRKGFTDSYDAMAGRLERHIGMALKQKEYGIVSSDRGKTGLENIKG